MSAFTVPLSKSEAKAETVKAGIVKFISDKGGRAYSFELHEHFAAKGHSQADLQPAISELIEQGFMRQDSLLGYVLMEKGKQLATILSALHI